MRKSEFKFSVGDRVRIIGHYSYTSEGQRMWHRKSSGRVLKAYSATPKIPLVTYMVRDSRDNVIRFYHTELLEKR